MRTSRLSILVVALALTVSLFAAGSASAAGLPKLLGGAGRMSFSVEPGQIGVSGDGTAWIGGEGSEQVGHRFPKDLGTIQWTRWDESGAEGAGLMWLNNCVPFCARGKFFPHAATIEASGASGGLLRRMTVRFRIRGHMEIIFYKLSPLGRPGPPYWIPRIDD